MEYSVPPVKVTRHALASEVLLGFPDARREHAGEGFACYLAERDARFYLVVDQSTLSEFLNEEDSGMSERLVQVFEFESAAERDEYLRSVLGQTYERSTTRWD